MMAAAPLSNDATHFATKVHCRDADSQRTCPLFAVGRSRPAGSDQPSENQLLGFDDPALWERLFWGPQQAPPAAQPESPTLPAGDM